MKCGFGLSKSEKVGLLNIPVWDVTYPKQFHFALFSKVEDSRLVSHLGFQVLNALEI